MSDALTIRPAVEDDLDALRGLMTLAIDRGQAAVLTPAQIVASRSVMGLDTQLVRDGTYFIVEEDGAAVGCGGWSRRATLYGGDHSAGLRDPALLDPARDAARIRAMYTHPDHVRRGIGRMVLDRCERAAAEAGFTAGELMSTASGERLYAACGYRPLERADADVGGVVVPLVRMRKVLHRFGTGG
ncbi:GNAT family N-acetyltransferase [uncultured Sphingomonas sp.]|uniref:GNAT family N-acetyltransferase n=1 Tax=uncultured Sphingomonas sp. TaxID=158754 RepID=UPI002590B53B|nr:GNAT family N-acetyltransferase [uncultured Sphingomonas sp.]